MLHDVRYALRVVRRSPGFTFLAVGTLALGIGATVTMFSVADAVLIRPVSYRSPEGLVQIWGRNVARNIPFHNVPYPDVAIWRQEARSFEALAALAGGSASLAGRGEPEMVSVARTNAELLPVLGVPLAAGRAYAPDDDRPGASPVAVISYELWQRRFGGDPAALGELLKLDGLPYRVVGILPAGFTLPAGRTDVMVPLADDGARERQGSMPPGVTVFGRLRPGVTLEQAQAEMDGLSRSLDERFPGSPQNRNVRVWSLTGFRTRDVRVSVLVLAAAVAMVLLVASVNVANLLLARAGARRGEVAVRLALGATRRRLVTQLLTESAVVGLAAGALGVGLAYWGVQALTGIAPARVPSLDRAGLDLRALSFALVVSGLTVVLFGLAPAFLLSRPADLTTLQGSLKDQGRRPGGAVGRRLRRSLVAAEVALSVMLLVGAVLLLQSFARLQDVNPGFNPRGVSTAGIALNAERYREPTQTVGFFRRFLDELQRTPGVTAAGITSSLPLSGHNQGIYMLAESGAVTRVEDAPIVWFRRVSQGYFRAMEIPLLNGRLFDLADERNTRTVIVNETMASRYWPGEDPIGRRVRPPTRDPRAPWLTVVGVVGSIHHMALAEPAAPEMYMPYADTPFRTGIVAVRTTLDPEALAPLMRRAAQTIDPEQALSSIRTLDSAMYDATAQERLSAALLTLFAIIAVALAVVGLCGVTSYLIDQRTHEIGVRVALGARRGDVLRLVFREGLAATAIGVVLGLAGALAASRVIASMLFGVSAWDPVAFAGAPIVLVLGALVGIWVPARRALAIDPLVALREP